MWTSVSPWHEARATGDAAGASAASSLLAREMKVCSRLLELVGVRKNFLATSSTCIVNPRVWS